MDLFLLAGEPMGTSIWEASIRLFIAALFGGAVGFDRERRDKPAGLRTHMLISLAAAIFTLIALELHAAVVDVNENTGADPIRIIEAVTSGVAFLAAGAIIQSRGAVHGITTGANMWLAGALGVACGSGYYVLAFIGTLFGLLILSVLGALERHLDPGDKGKPV